MSAFVVKGLYVAFFASSFVLIATQNTGGSGFSSSGSGGVACGNGDAEQCGSASGAGIEEDTPTESETNVSVCDRCVPCYSFMGFLGVHPCILTDNITADIQRCDVFVPSSIMIAQSMLPRHSRCIRLYLTVLRYEVSSNDCFASGTIDCTSPYSDIVAGLMYVAIYLCDISIGGCCADAVLGTYTERCVYN